MEAGCGHQAERALKGSFGFSDSRARWNDISERSLRGVLAHRGKETKPTVVADGPEIPLGAELTGATPHKITLIEKTLNTTGATRSGRGGPRKHLLRSRFYDRAAESRPLRKRLMDERKIDLICPWRSITRSRFRMGVNFDAIVAGRKSNGRMLSPKTLSGFGSIRS
jgi:hypothetical protein